MHAQEWNSRQLSVEGNGVMTLLPSPDLNSMLSPVPRFRYFTKFDWNVQKICSIREGLEQLQNAKHKAAENSR